MTGTVPERRRNSSASHVRARGRPTHALEVEVDMEVEKENPTSIPSVPTTNASEGVVVARKELEKRGVTNPREFEALSPDVILETCRWFDSQGNAGPGLLVSALRTGGRHGRQGLMRQQNDYADSVVVWLRRTFPNLDRPGRGPHPAAVAAVMRLHQVHGKGTLTKREHGPTICAAVVRWDETWGA